MCRELRCSVYSRSYSMRTGKDRVQVEAVNVPVNIGDARVNPGDLMRGDADGVLVIPKAHEDAVLAAAEEDRRGRAADSSGAEGGQDAGGGPQGARLPPAAESPIVSATRPRP